MRHKTKAKTGRKRRSARASRWEAAAERAAKKIALGLNLSVAEAAVAAGCSEMTLRRVIARGQLAVVRLSERTVVVRPKDLEELMQQARSLKEKR